MRRWLFLLSALAVLAVLGREVVEAEALIRSGEIVLLETAPVDPRSLLQGDYMRLAWAIERDARLDDADAEVVILGLDDRRIGRFRRVDRGEARGPDERAFAVARQGANGVRVEPHSFLFQEGRAADFARARYGIFRVAPNGRHLLVGLADADAVAIGPRPSEPPAPR